MLRPWLENYFQQRWYEKPAKHWLWQPLSVLYTKVVKQRRMNYLQQPTELAATLPPVLVVGNMTVGGTGKTPLVIHLIETLRAQGLSVAVLSRGYGGHSEHYPLVITPDSSPAHTGDEPYMIFQRTGVRVVVDPNRLRGLQQLAQLEQVDVVISDDGLQHYQLPRRFEIVMIDAARGLGNGACLPAGPLREPIERLQTVDAIVVNGDNPDPALLARLQQFNVPVFEMHLEPQQFLDLYDSPKALDSFTAQQQLFAIAGIGNPERFFNTLKQLGLDFKSKAFPDHYCYTAKDFANLSDYNLLMTEKDAVKVKQVLPSQLRSRAFYLAVSTWVSSALIDAIISAFPQDG